jgi:anhydro-N-acetylmuramic acid kinase
MIYKAIGIMSGSSLDGLDIAYVHFQETGGKWRYELLHTGCYPYSEAWAGRLKDAISLSALDYQLLHTAYGHYLGQQVNKFIDAHGLHHQVDLVASHGHTTFHVPQQQMTGQIGDGAAIAAETQLPVVSDLRAMDIAFGGQGAPIVPIGEKLLLDEYAYFLNLGGIANISAIKGEPLLKSDPSLPEKGGSPPVSSTRVAFDVCPANRVLNMLVQEMGKEYDDGGAIAATGTIHQPLLDALNELDFYKMPYPKSLANDFGTDIVYPIIQEYNLSTADELRTYVEHIAIQIKDAIVATGRLPVSDSQFTIHDSRLLVTGGGALNTFMIERLNVQIKSLSIEAVVPEKNLVNYKEALIMALMGVLRWREEYNVLASVTGAKRNSINGAVWLGNEA